jgi:hypothetical protein
LKNEGHYVPPGCGDIGFFSCKPKEKCATCNGVRKVENSSSDIAAGGPEMVKCPTCNKKG